MGEQEEELIPRGKGLALIVIVVLTILFVTTPFMIDYRITSMEINAPIYDIRLNEWGIQIFAPFPPNMSGIPNPFLWMDWVMIIFMFVLAGHYLGWFSERITWKLGWISLGPGLLTFFVNLLGTILWVSGIPMGSIIFAVPVPIPALAGLLIMKVYPCKLVEPWPDEVNQES